MNNSCENALKKIRSFKIGPRAPWPEWDTSLLSQPYLDVEIGAGAGLHAIRYCENFKERHLIAIERTSDKFEKLRRRKQNHPHLLNLTAVQADASLWLPHHLKAACVDNYFILYPNPYPKTKQANQRWVNMPFMSFLISTLKVNGQIIMATNKKDYADEAVKGFSEQWGLICIENRLIKFDEPPRTHFEKKYLERKDTCYNLVFLKTKKNTTYIRTQY